MAETSKKVIPCQESKETSPSIPGEFLAPSETAYQLPIQLSGKVWVWVPLPVMLREGMLEPPEVEVKITVRGVES